MVDIQLSSSAHSSQSGQSSQTALRTRVRRGAYVVAIGAVGARSWVGQKKFRVGDETQLDELCHGRRERTPSRIIGLRQGCSLFG